VSVAPKPTLACTPATLHEAAVFTSAWSPTERSTLTNAMSLGIVVVRYDGCSIEVLQKCKATGSYRWNAIATRKEHVRLRKVEDLHHIPRATGAPFALEMGSESWVEAAIDGRFEMDRAMVRTSDLQGACEGATHTIAAVGVGASRIVGDDDRVIVQDGDASTCPIEPQLGVAPKACSSPVRLELLAVGERRLCPPSLVWDEKSCVADTHCPRGYNREHGACVANGMKIVRSAACASTASESCVAECASGVAASCSEMSYRHWTGDAAIKDPDLAIQLATKACDANDLRGCSNLGSYLTSGAKKDLGKAVPILEKACNAGAPAACYELGRLSESGKDVAKDLSRAASFYAKACDLGNGFACRQHGDALRHGDGVAKDATLAFKRYKRGCELGSPIACGNLADAYDYARGVAEDPMMAVAYLRTACDAGLKGDCVGLGWMYAHGRGVPKDVTMATALFAMGCNAGEQEGCARYGEALLVGDGIERDTPRGQGLLTKACDGGEKYACMVISVNMRDGTNGYTKDLAGAFPLAKKSCDAGSEAGCNVLGWAYEHGLGTAKDKSKAIESYRLGCAKKQKQACENLDRLEAKK
jgi:TPR repeat protein